MGGGLGPSEARNLRPCRWVPLVPQELRGPEQAGASPHAVAGGSPGDSVPGVKRGDSWPPWLTLRNGEPGSRGCCPEASQRTLGVAAREESL